MTIKLSKMTVVTLSFAAAYIPLAQTNYFIYIILFFLTLVCSALFLCALNEKNKVWFSIADIMLVLAVVSLIFYLGGTVFNIIPNSGITTFEWSYTRTCNNYYNLYYESQKLNMGGGFFTTRNCGIFTEAPMYSFLLGVSLAVETFLRNSVNKKKCLIYILTIITTRSTTGILCILLCAFLYYVNKALRSKKHDIKRTLVFVLFFGVIGVAAVVLSNKLEQVSGSNSTSIRSDHVLACLKAWLENPIIGQGYLNQDAVMQYEDYQQGISIGLLYMLATGGIILFSTLLLPFIVNAIRCIKRKQYEQFSFGIVILFLYFLTAITGTPIIISFIAFLAEGTSVGAREDLNFIENYQKSRVRIKI